MRPLLALILAIAIIVGVQSFISAHSRSTVAPPTLVQTEAEGKFQVELVLTFDAGPDEFALDLSDAPSVVLQRQGKELLRETEIVKANTPIIVDAPDVVEGKNEFHLTTTPAEDNPDAIRAVRVRILRDGEGIADKTIWSEPGLAVEGTVSIDVEAASGEDNEEDEHNHE